MPTINLLAVNIGWLIGGTVIIENVFSIPGMGQLLVRGIFTRDYMVVQGVAMAFAVRQRRGELPGRHPDRRPRPAGEAVSAVAGTPAARLRLKLRLPRVPGALWWGAGIVGFFVLTALLAPVLAPYDPIAQDTANALLPPGPGHLARHRQFRPRRAVPR